MSFAEVVSNLEYGMDFGILGGLTKTVGIDIGEITMFSEIERKALFHPKHSKRIRRLCLETIVNGKVTENQVKIAHDLADVASMVRSIGLHQWDEPETKDMLAKKLTGAFASRSDVGESYFQSVLKMFHDKELYVCLTNSHHVLDFLNTSRNNVETLCKAINDNYEKLGRVGYFCVEDKVNPATDWLIRSVGYLAVSILTGDKALPYAMKNNISHLRQLANHRSFPREEDVKFVLDTLTKLEKEFNSRYSGE